MLTILCGTNQSEKSAQMRRLASEAAKRDASSVQQTVLWLTPDQFTFETERALMYRLQPEVRRKMLVTGFMRFSGMMLKRFGGAAVRYADNLCKTILMRRSLADCKDLLTRYARQAQMEDAQFEGQALSFVRQCKFAGVTPDELLRVSNSGKLPEQLRAKAGDLAQIAMQYEARISSAWRDSLDDLSAAKEKLLQAEERGERYFAGKTVFLDGFKSFTAPQYDLIALMLRQGATVYAALTLDKKQALADRNSLFSITLDTYDRLLALSGGRSDELNFSENPPVTALEAVKTGLFSDPIPTFAPDDTVQMYICRDEYAEAESCFGRLKELVKDEGLRYRDIAVVYRNEQDYLLPIAAAAEKFEIPYCVDGGLPPQTEPLFLVCVALLKSAFVQFSAIDLLTILRSGLFAVTDEDAAQLEEYLNVWRPSSVADWSRPFTARLSGYEADEFGGDTPLGDAPELLRKRLMDLLIPLRKKSEATGREYGALLYDILGKSGILEQFARRMQQSDLEEQLHAKRVWASFDDILTRLSDTLAEEVVSGAVYERLFVQSVKESRIKSVVQTMDCVMVGSADQIRLHEPRVMWILGANDGIFPKRPAAMNGLFTDAECKAFSELDLTVGKTLEERIAEERFIAYQMLCAPQERLYVSCRAADLGGGRQLAGEILWRMKVMFGSEPKDGALPESAYMTTAAAAFDAYCALARNDPEQASKYLDLLKKMPDNPYQTALAAVEKLLSPKRYLLSEPQTVERLYTLYERMLSPSEIEQYFRCPFAYFVKYGLKLRVKERAVYNPLLRGNLLHHVIAALTLPLSQMAKTDATQAAQTGEAIAPEQVKARISRMVEEAFTAELAALFDEPGRICAKDKALAQGMQLRVTRIAENIYAEQMQSKFRVFAVECDVGGGAIAPLSIPVGKKQVRIRGRIDRLDTYTEQGQTFFRIIDYKTGDKKFEYAKLMNGEHLQMILYEMAVSAGGRGGFANLVPAGVLYYPAREAAYLSDQETSEEEYRAHLDSSYCMNGILVDERETLSRVRAMEETLSQRYIPVGLNKRNQFDDQSLRSEEEYRRIEQYVGIQVRRMATEVSCGEIAPAYLVDREPCKYCSYAALCGSDLRTESIGREKISEQEAKDSILGQEETTWD